MGYWGLSGGVGSVCVGGGDSYLDPPYQHTLSSSLLCVELCWLVYSSSGASQALL